MTISIVIPNYNGSKYINKCIDSILNSKTKHEYEIIVIDNNSTDNSIELLSKYTRIKLIKNSVNTGFSYAVNQGIKEAKGQYIILLNNDIEVEIDYIEQLANAIQGNADIFSVSSKMVKYNDRNIIDDAGDFYNILGWAYQRGHGQSNSKYAESGSVFSACGGAAIYRKSVFDEIGLFDENFFAYMEDVDIGFRAKINGYKNIYCHEAIVYHVGSATSGSKYNAFKVKLAARNNIYTFYKNTTVLIMLINIPFFAVGCGIKYIFFKKKGLNKEYVAGIKEGICSLKKIERTKFKFKNIFNYVKIEVELIMNVFRYIASKIS